MGFHSKIQKQRSQRTGFYPQTQKLTLHAKGLVKRYRGGGGGGRSSEGVGHEV